MVTETEKLSVPKTSGEAIDLLWNIRSKRLEAEKYAEMLKEQESSIREQLVQMLEDQGLKAARGTKANFSFSSKPVPQVTNWDKFYAYVKKYNAFELLHKRIGAEAWQERVDAGKTVPGVEVRFVPTYSITKG